MLEDFVFVPVEKRCVAYNTDKEALTTYTYNDQGWLTRYETTEQGLVSPVTYTYDQKGNLLLVQEGDGGCSQYSYDENGNRVSSIAYAGNGEESARVECRYDDKNQLVEEKTTDATGVTLAEYAYDEQGRQIGSKKSYPNGDWLTVINEYDPHGNLVKNRMEDNHGWQESTAEYDEAGRKLRAWSKSSSGQDHESTYEYDQAGRCVKEVHPAGTVEYTYDEVGRKRSEKTLFNVLEEYAYDDRGRLVSLTTTQPEGDVSSLVYTYDEADRVLSATQVSGTTTKVSSCTYDGYGNVLTQRETVGTYVYEYTYQWAVYYYPAGLNEVTAELVEEWERTYIKVAE